MRRGRILTLALLVLVGGLAVPAKASGHLHRISLTGRQDWLVLLCQFPGGPVPHPRSWYEGIMGATYPGEGDFWRNISYGQISFAPTVIGWYSLPQPKSAYFNAGSPDTYRYKDDCLAAVDAQVNLPDYEGIAYMVNEDLGGAWNYATFTTRTLDGQSATYGEAFIVAHGHNVMTHEIAHALPARASTAQGGGFLTPHSGEGGLESAGDVLGKGGGLTHPEYQSLAPGTIAYHRDLLGWIPDRARFQPVAGATSTFSVHPLGGSLPSTGYLWGKIPITGSSRFYSIEGHQPVGYDQRPPGYAQKGVVLHLVDENIMRTNGGGPAELITHGDPSLGVGDTLWLPGESFVDTAADIRITVMSESPTGEFVIDVRPASAARPTPSPSNSTTPMTSSPPTGTATEHVLSVGVNGAGRIVSMPEGIDCPADRTAAFPEGTMVALTAAPSPGSSFVRWTGTCSTIDRICDVVMDSERSAEAQFLPDSEFRAVSLNLRRHLTAKVIVTAAEGHDQWCVSSSRVSVERFKRGRWVSVGSGTASVDGTARVRLEDKPGRYRASVPKVLIGEDAVCPSVRSSERTHSHG